MKISRISLLHCYKLVFRSLLLLAALALYIVGRVKGSEGLFGGLEENRVVLGIIWGAFAFEMVLRFFPNKSESMGCQKQFGRNYRPYEGQEHAHIRTVPHRAWRTWICLAAWLTLNIPFGILYYAGVLDAGILVLISLAYAVCDMICILFFCPFQTWILKNKCCTTCRIYNWDFAMMFTPPDVYLASRDRHAFSAVACAAVLLGGAVPPVSRAVCRGNEQLSCLLSLQGKALSP